MVPSSPGIAADEHVTSLVLGWFATALGRRALKPTANDCAEFVEFLRFARSMVEVDKAVERRAKEGADDLKARAWRAAVHRPELGNRSRALLRSVETLLENCPEQIEQLRVFYKCEQEAPLPLDALLNCLNFFDRTFEEVPKRRGPPGEWRIYARPIANHTERVLLAVGKTQISRTTTNGPLIRVGVAAIDFLLGVRVGPSTFRDAVSP
jgi:hypothetical protein